jgi:hypothetical protein
VSTPLAPRQRVRALAQRRGDGRGIAVPLAHRLAARIQERDWEDFTCDPTQLANGLRDLADAVDPDGVAVSLPEVLLEGGRDVSASEQTAAALEATRRLRTSFGDRLALLAVLPGPADVEGGAAGILACAKEFLGAGADGVVVLGPPDGSLSTLANVARFHQAVALGDDPGHGLPLVERRSLNDPAAGGGVVLTDVSLDRDTDVSVLEDWVLAVRG